MDLLNRKDVTHLRQRLRSRNQFTMAEFARIDLTTITLAPFARDLQAGHLNIETWARGKCMLVEDTISRPIVNHRLGRKIDASSDLVAIHRYMGGGSTGYVAGTPMVRDPGSTYFIDLALTWQGIRAPGTVQSIFIPKSLLEYETGHHPGSFEIKLTSAVGQCVTAQLDQLFGPLRRADELIVEPVLQQLLACLKISIGTPPQSEDVRQHLREALFLAICDFIEHNLEASDLSADRILENFGVSRASLYRMFEPHGGVRNYITGHRALRAVFDLAAASGKRGEVRAIGEKWGFSNAVEFNRTMRRLYDSSPGALFAPAKPAQPKIAA